jgi:hypothetical protein
MSNNRMELILNGKVIKEIHYEYIHKYAEMELVKKLYKEINKDNAFIRVYCDGVQTDLL